METFRSERKHLEKSAKKGLCLKNILLFGSFKLNFTCFRFCKIVIMMSHNFCNNFLFQIISSIKKYVSDIILHICHQSFLHKVFEVNKMFILDEDTCFDLFLCIFIRSTNKTEHLCHHYEQHNLSGALKRPKRVLGNLQQSLCVAFLKFRHQLVSFL